MSRLVMIPRSTPSGETTGRPEIRYLAHSSSTSAIVVSGPQVTGLVIIPAWERLTMSTWCAWSSIDMLRCRTPTPPCLAMATAMVASVTVSMAEDSSGSRSEIRLVSLALVSASLGKSCECAGSSRTSSKVSAGEPNLASSVISLPDAARRAMLVGGRCWLSSILVIAGWPAVTTERDGVEAGVLDDVVSYLRCPHCRAGLTRAGGSLPCPARHHCYIPRQGYVSLLQPGVAGGAGGSAAVGPPPPAFSPTRPFPPSP